MPEFSKLQIPAYDGGSLPNTFVRQSSPSDHLAVIFPGAGYSCSMPLLYYSSLLLTSMGAEVLEVEYNYRDHPGLASEAEGERARRFISEVSAAYRAGLAQGSYSRLTLIGKSLGTLALAYLLANEEAPGRVEAVWLTPLLGDERLLPPAQAWGGRSLFIIGTADPYWSAGLLSEIEAATDGSSIVVEGADHSMEIPGDIYASLRTVESIVRGIESFLQQG